MTDDTHDDFAQPFGTGGIPSPLDTRDWPVELDTAVALPSRFLLPGIPPVMNQHKTPKCGGYSGAGIKAVQERADGKGFLRFDPDDVYAHAQLRDGISLPHVGTTARGVCKALAKVGARVVGSQKRHRIASYQAVPWTYDAIKRSIFQYRTPVLIGASWYRSWFDPRKGINPPPDVRTGGHLFYVWAWDDDVAGGSLLAQNSWGLYPGSVNGRMYMPARYTIPAIHDAWRLIDAKGD